MQVKCDDCGRIYVAKMRERRCANGSGEVIIGGDTIEIPETPGVFQYMQCPYCRAVVAIAHISDQGLILRARIEKHRRGGERAPEELLEEYGREVTEMVKT